jgi:hypothetical protein
MTDLRAVLAAVLGVGIGLLCLLYPEAVVRAHTVGRTPHDRRGEYGADGGPPGRWRRAVRLLGAGALLVGIYVGATAVAAGLG